jgi:hypothetical protein
MCNEVFRNDDVKRHTGNTRLVLPRTVQLPHGTRPFSETFTARRIDCMLLTNRVATAASESTVYTRNHPTLIDVVRDNKEFTVIALIFQTTRRVLLTSVITIKPQVRKPMLK